MKTDLQLLNLELLPYPSELVFTSENIEIQYYPEIKIIHFLWKQRTLGDLYRKAFLDGIEYIKKFPETYFISDIRNQGIVGPEDRHWFETVALPRAIKANLKRCALVFDGNVFKQYYINMILKQTTKRGFPMKIFRSNDSAVEWILNYDSK